MKKKIIVGLIVSILSLTVVGCSSNDTQNGTSTVDKEIMEEDKANYENFQDTDREFYVVDDINFKKDASGVYLEGSIKNNSGEKLNYMSISFDLFNDNNHKIGTAKANVNNIEAEGIWEFFTKGTPIVEEVVEPTTEEAVEEEVTTEEAVEGEITTEEAVEGEAATEEAVEGEATTEEAVEGEAATEEAVEGEATTEEVVEGEAATEEAVEGEATTEEVVEGEAATEEVVEEEAATEEVVEEETTTEEVVEEETTTEEATEDILQDVTRFRIVEIKGY